jgi:rubrerythrin
MDLRGFDERTLLLAAVRSEIESKKAYQQIAEGVRNALLKDKLIFLASEEEKHRALIEGVFAEKFPAETLAIPDHSPVPLPRLNITDEIMPLTEVFEAAMNAEKAAHDFYNELASLYDAHAGLKKTIAYVATMEMGHYKLLEIEKHHMERFEDFDVYTPSIHIGP